MQDQVEEKKMIKRLSIEIDFQADGNIEQCITSMTYFTMDLIKKWMKSTVIDGVWALDGTSLMKSEFENVKAWAIPPRVIKKNQSALAEIIVSVKSDKTAYELCMDQKDFCDKHLIKVSTKRTIMEHVNKIGCITGPYAKLASADYHIEDINKRLKLSEGLIGIKKEHTCERRKRSKVLAVYAIEKNASQINEDFSKLTNTSTRYQFISYRKTTSEERLASMHHNEMINIKARCESLFNASLKELVFVSSRRYERLETVIMKANCNGHRLFLAAEQGSGTYKNSVMVVINPSIINKAKEWIANEYPKLDFKEEKMRETSIDPELFKVDAQHNEQLREFLRPTLQSKEIKKIKGFNKNMKSFAQVLGCNENNKKDGTINNTDELTSKIVMNKSTNQTN